MQIGITVAGAGRLEESHCLFNSRVIGLDPNGDNFLSVRRRPNGPSGLAYEIDQLFTNDRVCVVSANGRRLNVRYQAAVAYCWVGYLTVTLKKIGTEFLCYSEFFGAELGHNA